MSRSAQLRHGQRLVKTITITPEEGEAYLVPTREGYVLLDGVPAPEPGRVWVRWHRTRGEHRDIVAQVPVSDVMGWAR